jgi:hypothetical protein
MTMLNQKGQAALMRLFRQAEPNYTFAVAKIWSGKSC